MFGLQGIKNVGTGAVAEIVAQREEAGPYASFTEFLERVELGQVNRKVVEDAGAGGRVRRPGRRARIAPR